ncbi:unnamed protein product [Linum trigynum]
MPVIAPGAWAHYWPAPSAGSSPLLRFPAFGLVKSWSPAFPPSTRAHYYPGSRRWGFASRPIPRARLSRPGPSARTHYCPGFRAPPSSQRPSPLLPWFSASGLRLPFSSRSPDSLSLSVPGAGIYYCLGFRRRAFASRSVLDTQTRYRSQSSIPKLCPPNVARARYCSDFRHWAFASRLILDVHARYRSRSSTPGPTIA